jgi:HD-GYP domain-containing protein (c-di-GMP phosphodiesterase class II)
MSLSPRSRGNVSLDDGMPLTFSSLIAALSFALDLTEGASPGHALRSCLVGMRIGKVMGLSEAQLCDLYYSLLLKDAGCSSNATRLHQIVGGDEIRAKALTKTIDYERLEWKQIRFLLRNVHARQTAGARLKAIGSMLKHSSENAEVLIRLRCEQGAAVVRDLGLGQGTAEAIYNLDEHWNGAGYPDRLAGEAIPLLARIVSLAQTLEVFHSEYGPAAALDTIQRRSGRWFDPEVVRAAVSLIRSDAMWAGIGDANLRESLALLEPRSRSVQAEPAIINSICSAFAGVIDAKSHSTFMHSTGVARIAVDIGLCLGVPQDELTMLHRAGLLHDIGKLSVPNSILDKPGKLTAEEWHCVKQHPRFTFEILSRVPTFAGIAEIAATHHEKLDGSGYYRGLRGEQLSQMSRILTVADMYEALTAARPYRAPMTQEDVLNILRRDVPHAIDATCFAALESMVGEKAPAPALEPVTVQRESIPNLAGMRESLGDAVFAGTAQASAGEAAA